MLKFYVHGQRLRMENAVVASGTIDYLTAAFVFQTEDWAGVGKTAIFEGAGETYGVLLTDDEIREEDHLNLAAGEWVVHVVGTGDGRRITTTQVRFMVEESGASSGDALPEISASYAEQILAAATEAKNVAQRVRDDAEAGKFAGPKGDRGEQGPKGDTGPAGARGAQGAAFTYDDFTSQQLAALKGADGSPGIVISSIEPTDPSHPVWIDPEGDETPDNPLGITGAVVGQIAKISAVDEDGKPTAWVPVDLPSGGGGETWEKIGDVEFSPDTSLYIVANFATWKKVKLLMNRNAYISGLSKNVWCKFYKGNSEYAAIGYMTMEYGYVYWDFSAEVNNLFAESFKNASNNRYSSTYITSTGFYILDNVSPDELSIGIHFTDTSVIQTGDKITVLGVRR